MTHRRPWVLVGKIMNYRILALCCNSNMVFQFHLEKVSNSFLGPFLYYSRTYDEQDWLCMNANLLNWGDNAWLLCCHSFILLRFPRSEFHKFLKFFSKFLKLFIIMNKLCKFVRCKFNINWSKCLKSWTHH